MPQPDTDYDGEIATTYAEGRSISPEALATWRGAVASLIPDSGVVVDVGAGTGRFARPLTELAPGRVVAVEPASGMRPAANVTEGGLGNRRPIWVGAAAEALPVASSSVALIWSAFTAHYLDLDRAAIEFARVLRPSGEVIIWHAFPDVFDDLEWFRWFPSARALDETRMPSASMVHDALTAAGLTFIGRADYRMRIADNLAALADRLAHRSISTLRLISDDEFAHGLAQLRAEAQRRPDSGPVMAPNVSLRFAAQP